MIVGLLSDDRYRGFLWLALILTIGLVAGCQNTSPGGGY
jgi:predicted small secreted protein